MKIPTFWIALTLVLVGVILLQRACTPGKCPDAKPVPVKSDTVFRHIHDTIHDTVLVPVTKIIEHRPAPITISDTVFITMVEPVDTARILKDYFATRNYSDTNRLEGYGNFIINDAITQNKIKNREIVYNLNIPMVTTTVAIKAKNQVYIGLDMGGTKDWLFFGPQFTLKTATDKMYHIGAFYTTQNSFGFDFGLDYKIHL